MEVAVVLSWLHVEVALIIPQHSLGQSAEIPSP